MGAGVIACAEVAKAKAKPASAINLIIFLLPWAVGTSRLVPKLRGCRTSAGYDFFELEP
jgi:hypothetical protein